MRLLIPLFSPPTGTWGGLTRVLALARAARAAGHSVAFCASGPMAAQLQAHDLPVYPTPAPGLFGLPAPASRLLVRFSQRVSLPARSGCSVGNIWLVLLATGFGRAGFLRRLVEAERQAARDFRADVLFTDLDPGAVLLARLEHLPLAANYAQIATIGRGSLAWRVIARAAMRTLVELGGAPATPDELCFGPSVLKIIPSIPELEDTDAARPDVRFVGPMLGELRPATATHDEFTPEPGRRYVFAYVGTGSVSLSRLCAVLPAVFPVGGDLRCVVAAQSIAAPHTLGAVEFRPWVDPERLLPQCDWTFCHGGQNTIMQSLRHGVPLLLFPGPIFERRYNAQKVVAAGAGLFAERNQLTVEWLRAALPQRAAHAHAAARLSARLRACRGAAAAIEAIERWLDALEKRRSRVHSSQRS